VLLARRSTFPLFLVAAITAGWVGCVLSTDGTLTADTPSPGSGATGGVGPTQGGGGSGATGGGGSGGAPDGGGGTGPTGGGGQGGGGCDPGQKLCMMNCVSIDDPAFGCAAPGCAACDLPNALAKCASGKCAVDTCKAGFDDCNSMDDDGCETPLGTNADCSTCGDKCAADSTCDAQACKPTVTTVNDLSLWLRAGSLAAGAVSQWSDESGKNNHFTQSSMSAQPVLVASGLNGLPAVDFDGVDDKLVGPKMSLVLPAGDKTVFAVVTIDKFSDGGGILADAGGYFYVQTKPAPANRINAVNWGMGDSASVDVPAPSVLVEVWHDGNNLRTRINGGAEVSKASGATGTVSNLLEMGGGGSGTIKLDFKLSEVVAYSRALQPNESQLVTTYLKTKYALP
jgi:hypothetical protein